MNRITIVIPTFNRSLFLDRALKFYDTTGFTGTILIGDSSDDPVEKKANKIVADNYPNLNVSYHYFNIKENCQHAAIKIYKLLDKITTPYVAYSGDDDFQIPIGLLKCIEFLEDRPDYIAAHGVRVNFILDEPVYGNIIAADAIEGYIWDTDDPIERWHKYMENGIATVYYVHRTPIWKKCFAYSNTAKADYIGNELIPCSLCAILGKVKKLDCITSVFQRNTPNKTFSFKKVTLWDLVIGPEWVKSVKIYEEAVVAELSKYKQITPEEAMKIFYREFWYHCLLVMNGQFNNRYGNQKEVEMPPVDFSTISEKDSFFPVYKILKGDF